jgi:CelD/BcsL family acetyltransferase involved in cellulose biosynthesis
MILAFFNASSMLVGLAPLSFAMERRSRLFKLRVIRLLGDGSEDSDNLDFPILPDHESEVMRALVDYLCSGKIQWDLCEFNTLPSASPGGSQLLRRLEEIGWTRVVFEDRCSSISLPESWEAYLNQLSSKERGKIRYYTQRLEKKYCVRLYKCTEPSELPVRLNDLFDLHGKRWKLKGREGTFALAARRQFYSDMSFLFLKRNWLEFWFLELNGKPVATQFGFRYRDTVFALQEGFDPEFALDSVGYVLRALVLRQLIEQGVRRYDFLGGRNLSKERWGTQTGSCTDLRFARPFTLGSFYLRLVNNANASKEWLRLHLPPWAWAALHWLNTRFRGRGRSAAG